MPSDVSGTFDLFLGDLEVRASDGNLYLVSDSNAGSDRIRVLSPGGALLGDVDLLSTGIVAPTTIAFDDVRDTAWIGAAGGMLYEVRVTAIPEPTSVVAFSVASAGWLFGRRRRKRPG